MRDSGSITLILAFFGEPAQPPTRRRGDRGPPSQEHLIRAKSKG
jgi:hypothetical protein